MSKQVTIDPEALAVALDFLEDNGFQAQSNEFRRILGHHLLAHGTCAYDGCEAPAETFACGRPGREWWDDEMMGRQPEAHPVPAWYCKAHAGVVCDEQSPEYHDSCPNCGCLFGVN